MFTWAAKSLVSFLSKYGAVKPESDEAEICQYGIEVGLSAVCNILIVFIIGLVFLSVQASCIFLFCFHLIRRHTGGYHSNTYLKCNIVFGCVFMCVLLISKITVQFNLTALFYGVVLLTLLGTGYVWKYAPVPNEHKQLTVQQRKKSHKIAIIGYIMCLFLGMLVSDYSIFEGMVIISTLLSIVILMLVVPKEVNRNETEESCS